MPATELSVVIPFLNERECLPLLKDRLFGSKDLPKSLELIFVSDGSTDGSAELVEGWAKTEPRVKMVELTRNFGHQAAICAGLDHARGRWVAVMDADLQDPPETLAEMFGEAVRGGWDIVYHVRAMRSGFWPKRAAYSLFYWSYSKLADSPIDDSSGDFCVLSREAVEILGSLPEKVRFVRGLRSWMGLKAKAFSAPRPERAAGAPQYSLAKLAGLAVNGLTSFSAKPMRLAMIGGAILCAGALTLACVYIVLALFFGLHEKVPGFATIVSLLLFLSGIQFIMMGVMGEYIGQIFFEVKGRPTYLVRRAVNIEKERSARE